MEPVSQLQIDAKKIYSVSEVTKDLKILLEDNFASLWISGEISNFKQAASGHCYFTLKDENAQIAAVMFKQAHRSLQFRLEDGLEVCVHGHITIYEARGQYQILIDAVEPKGLGALQLAFEQLKKKLLSEGLFDKEHKKPLPLLPKKIGIVTSPKGAAIHDIVNVLTRRYPNIEILLYPVRVQGEGAGIEIAHAINEMNLMSDIDVLIVGRGGGSLEDLWAFNEEVVVRALFNSRIPVVSAVGHETDTTLTDYVADLRAPTPSAAAEMVVPVKEDLICIVRELQQSLISSITHLISHHRDQVSFLKKQLVKPRQLLEGWRLKVDDLASRLTQAIWHYLKEKQYTLKEIVLGLKDPQQKIREARLLLEGIKGRLVSLSPLAPLERGYSLVFKEGETRPIRSITGLNGGDGLTIQLSDGKVKVRVV